MVFKYLQPCNLTDWCCIPRMLFKVRSLPFQHSYSTSAFIFSLLCGCAVLSIQAFGWLHFEPMCAFSVHRISHQDVYPSKSQLLTLGFYQPLFPLSNIGKNRESLLYVSLLYAVCCRVNICLTLLDGTPGSGCSCPLYGSYSVHLVVLILPLLFS